MSCRELCCLGKLGNEKIKYHNWPLAEDELELNRQI